MLTGDNARTTAAIAGSLGLAAKAVLLPASKLAEIGALMAHGGIRQGGRRHQPRAIATGRLSVDKDFRSFLKQFALCNLAQE